jgi:hypothetical protein
MNVKQFNEFFSIASYRIGEWIENWIYPAYNLKNLLFYRFDLVKCNKIKPWEYSDVVQRMEYANFEMVKYFVEVERPEEVVVWYKDDSGADVGHKYGESKDEKIVYPKLRGTYIMDLIKEIYQFYTVDLPELNNDYTHILNLWSKYCFTWDKADKRPYEINCPEFLSECDWNICQKYFKTKEEIQDGDTALDVCTKIEKEIFNKTQYYLHLCIEVRPYLWT